MKKIYFQQIADSRFCDNIVNEIEKLKKGTDEALENIGAKNTASGICQFLDWKDGTQQYRVDYIVEKSDLFSFRELFCAVNKIKAVVYKIK